MPPLLLFSVVMVESCCCLRPQIVPMETVCAGFGRGPSLSEQAIHVWRTL